MGNCTSCCSVEQPHIAKLVDVHGNLEYIKLPITAAEIMLEQPGLVVSPADDLRLNSRLMALRADDKLYGGKSYMLIPTGRVHAKVTKSEMEIVDFACKRTRRAVKKCSSKIPAAAVGIAAEGEEEDERLVSKNGLGEKGAGFTGYVIVGSCRQWKPVLEPIFEVRE